MDVRKRDEIVAGAQGRQVVAPREARSANEVRADTAKVQANANIANVPQQQRPHGPFVAQSQAQLNQAQAAVQNQYATTVPPPPAPAQAELKTKVDEVVSTRAAPAVAAETAEVSAAPAAKDKKEAVQGPMQIAPSSGIVAGTLVRAQPVAGVAKKLEAVRWSISPDGQVTRSADGRKWAEVPIAAGVVFRAISANGGDIWAGGSGGALFHSSDGGERWTRVRPSTAGTALTADVTRIEFTNPLYGAVLTASGEKWTTADGGKTWSVN